MKITNKLIEEGASSRGGWNRAQLELLGVSWPPFVGWKHGVIGNEISNEDASRFLELKDHTVRPRRNRRGQQTPVKTDLPFTPRIPADVQTTIASFHLYLTRLDKAVLRECLPALSMIVSKASNR